MNKNYIIYAALKRSVKLQHYICPPQRATGNEKHKKKQSREMSYFKRIRSDVVDEKAWFLVFGEVGVPS